MACQFESVGADAEHCTISLDARAYLAEASPQTDESCRMPRTIADGLDSLIDALFTTAKSRLALPSSFHAPSREIARKGTHRLHFVSSAE
jgi:hypothetical protein